MIEQVKEFTAELQIESLGDPGVLEQGEIKVIYTRAVEKSAPGITLCAQSRGSERRRQEVLAARFARVLNHDWRD
jgi:hypothetical protein